MENLIGNLGIKSNITDNMKRKFFYNALALLILLAVFSPFFVPDIFAQMNSGAGTGGGTPTVPISSPLKAKNLEKFMLTVLENVVIKIGSIVAVIFLIYSGYLFVEGRGAPAKIDKAKETFTWTLVGIAILLGAQAIAMIVTDTIEKVSK